MLSSELVNQFHRDGFCSATGILSRDELNALLADVESISAGATVANHDSTRSEMEPNQAQDGTSVRRLYEPCTHYPRFRALSESGNLLDCLAQLLGENQLFPCSKLNMKPPAIGSVVEWHQDLAYYRSQTAIRSPFCFISTTRIGGMGACKRSQGSIATAFWITRPTDTFEAGSRNVSTNPVQSRSKAARERPYSCTE